MDEPAYAIVGIDGADGGQVVTLSSPRLALGEAGTVSVEQVQIGPGCIDASADTDNLLGLPEACFAPLDGSPVPTIQVPSRCDCNRCRLESANEVPSTYRNPICSSFTLESYEQTEEDWCLLCSQCTATQFETRGCRASHPDDHGNGENRDFLDRACQDCMSCGYDDYEASRCGGDDGRTDRVCVPKLMEGYPVRRKDGRTGSRGRLIDGFSGQVRNGDCMGEFEFQYSDNRREEGSEAWFRVDEVRRSNVRFTYVFAAENHREYRFIFG